MAADATPNGVICGHMTAVGVYPSDGGQVLAAGLVRGGCLDAPQIVIQRGTTNFDLYVCEAKVGEVRYLPRISPLWA